MSIDALDGLRGIAILLVLAVHAVGPFRGSDGQILPIGGWDLATPLINGWVGVDLFFVLSGFLITHHILRRRDRAGGLNIGRYAWRRVVRIIPTYYVVMAVVLLGLIPYYNGDWIVPYYDPDAVDFAVIVGHLLFVQDYMSTVIVGPFWSLGVEEKFYVVVPLLLLVVTRIRSDRTRYLLLALFFITPTLARTATYLAQPDIAGPTELLFALRTPFHVSFEGFIAGLAAALIYRSRSELPWVQNPTVIRRLFWSGATLVFLLLVVTPLIDGSAPLGRIFAPTLLAAGFGALLFSLVIEPRRAQWLFGSRFLFFFAKIAYPLYLIHLPLIPPVMVLMATHFNLLAYPSALQFVLFFVPWVAFASVAALALHYGVEKPGLALRDARWPGRRKNPTTQYARAA